MEHKDITYCHESQCCVQQTTMNHADDLLFSGDGNFTVGVQGTFDNKGNKCDANKDSRLADYK